MPQKRAATGTERIIRAAMKDAERRALLLPLWLQRPPDKRTGNDLLIFHAWLEQNRPELLARGRGDPYQYLKVDLRGHIDEKPPKPPKE
jgi:hypothetical protein